MKTKKDNYDVMKEIRQIRKKIYNDIKNMSIEEQVEYYRKEAESFDKMFSGDGKEENNENEKRW